MSSLNYRQRTRPPLSRSAIALWCLTVGFVGGTIATWIGVWLT